MKNTTMHHYFSFLRFALGLEPLSDTDKNWLKNADWHKLLHFAKRQALVGVYFEGIKQLPKELAPSADIVLKWLGLAESIRKRNIVLNRASAAIYNKVCEAGFRCCILKGQGNVLMYSNPYSRMPGDVDVWAIADRDALRRLANELTKDNGTVGEESYNHIELSVDGIPVELHPTPAILCNLVHNHRLQKWLQRNADLQCSNNMDLPDGTGHIAIPTATFNAVYQLQHIYHHHFFEGIGLRQFVDYLLVLRSIDFTGECRKAFIHDLKHLGLYHFAGAVMYVLHSVFGLSEEDMPVPIDKKRGSLLMEDIIRGGNFGQYDERHTLGRGAIGHNIQRLVRDLRLMMHYPSEALSEPLFRLWHWCWRKCH